MANYQQYIVSDHSVLLGKPVIKGTRITVAFILKKLAEGAPMEELAQQYGLSIEAIHAALEYAAERMADREDLVAEK